MLGFAPISALPLSSSPVLVPVVPTPPAYFPHNYFASRYFAPLYFPPLAVTPVPTPVVPPTVVVPGLREEAGRIGGYLIPEEFIPTSRFFGHPRPHQVRPPRLPAPVSPNLARLQRDDEELLGIGF
jgi:hypothetical protein